MPATFYVYMAIFIAIAIGGFLFQERGILFKREADKEQPKNSHRGKGYYDNDEENRTLLK